MRPAAKPGWRHFARGDLTLLHEKDRWGTHRLQLKADDALTLDAYSHSPCPILPDPRRFTVHLRSVPVNGVVEAPVSGGGARRLARAVAVLPVALAELGLGQTRPVERRDSHRPGGAGV